MNRLQIERVNTGYDKKQVLFDISFEVNEGECILLVGSNGSGKSTLFKAIYRCLDLWGENGKVSYNGEDISELKPYQLIEKGIMYIPQKEELFENLTVMENLELSVLHWKDKKKTVRLLQDILTRVPLLKQKIKQEVSSLSGGERKLLSLGMALLNQPKVLLFDEPLAGLSGENVKMLIGYLTQIKENGTTLVLIEHRVKELLQFADRIIGLKLGHIIKQKLNTLDNIKTLLI